MARHPGGYLRPLDAHRRKSWAPERSAMTSVTLVRRRSLIEPLPGRLPATSADAPHFL